jgi:hypothetical protein
MARICSANAREMAARSARVRRERKNAEHILAAFTQPEQVLAGDFPRQRLARVRVQLDRLDEMMMKEKDPQRLDRIASAQAKLAEQERILDGRPLPGSRKPAANKPDRQRPPMADPQ